MTFTSAICISSNLTQLKLIAMFSLQCLLRSNFAFRGLQVLSILLSLLLYFLKLYFNYFTFDNMLLVGELKQKSLIQIFKNIICLVVVCVLIKFPPSTIIRHISTVVIKFSFPMNISNLKCNVCNEF